MDIATLPAAVQTAFQLAGVVPVFLAGLNRDAWLSSQVKIDGHPALFLNASVEPERLAVIADQVLAAGVDRIRRTA